MKKFGTFSGVFVPSFEAILGAVLFLLIPMLTGVLGFAQMALIVLLSNTVTLATAFSISDCATNALSVGAGGMYAISRRSLGKAFGGSIGIQLFIAQSASIGFYAAAFADPLTEILKALPGIGSLLNSCAPELQVKIVAIGFAALAFALGLIGADFASKIQFVIFIILIISILAIIFTPLIDSSDNIFTGTINWWGAAAAPGSQIPLGFTFWIAFTMFFPAVTGIDAGVGMSGNLKDTARSLPKGTFIAIGITFVVYMVMSFVFSLIDPSLMYTVDGSEVKKISAVLIFNHLKPVMIILQVGIMVASGSSGLAYFLTAPRTAQAMAQDKVLPRMLNFLAKDFTRSGKEPRWATVLTCIIVMAVIWFFPLEESAKVVGICFLLVYGWVNFAAFLERLSGNPSFRPVSKGHWAISLVGFLLCMVVISLFNPLIGLALFSVQIIIFLLLLNFKSRNRLEGVWWGVLFRILNWGFKRMRRIIQGTKNWRPIIGVFCMADNEAVAKNTMEMGRTIADYKGLISINILKPDKMSKALTFPISENARIIDAPGDDFENSITSILQAAMPGGIQFNTALLALDKRLNHIDIIEGILKINKNVLLYSHGSISEPRSNRIDVWWKGEENGNLMALLAYIINASNVYEGRPRKKIKLLRKLFKGENKEKAEIEMNALLKSARLGGEVEVLAEDASPINESIALYSADAELILMGLPGEKVEGIAKLFSIDSILFNKAIKQFENLPPLLFVKASGTIELFE